MPSPHLNELIRFAREEMPLLAHDMENASTIFALQACCKRLHTVTNYLLHHIVMSDPSVVAAAAAATAATAAQRAQTLPPPPPGFRYARSAEGQLFFVPTSPAPAAMPAQTVGHPPATEHFPSQGPAVTYSPPPGGLPPLAAPIVPPPPNVAEVFVTPQATRVKLPGSTEAVTVPPGETVDVAGMMQPTVGHGAAVMLPEGGAMTPEVMAALAARSRENNPGSNARNITDDVQPTG
jgi:hypothetical protein